MGGSLTGLHVQALLAIDERKYQGDGLLGLLLHDPMAGIAYHDAAHIGCGKGNFCRKAGAIGMITTNRQTGIASLPLASSSWLSIASWANAANCPLNALWMAPERA